FPELRRPSRPGRDGVAMRILEGHEAPVRCLSFSPDGRWLVSGDEHRVLYRWHLTQGFCGEVLDATPESDQDESIEALAFAPDDPRLALGDSSGSITLYDLARDSLSPAHAHAGGVRALAWSRDGERLLSVGAMSGASLWNGRTLADLGSWDSILL